MEVIRKVKIKCERCENNLAVASVKRRPVGYKGKMEFFIRCDECQCNNIIPEAEIPEDVKKRAYKEASMWLY